MIKKFYDSAINAANDDILIGSRYAPLWMGQRFVWRREDGVLLPRAVLLKAGCRKAEKLAPHIAGMRAIEPDEEAHA